MPNARYRELIRLRYMEELNNELVAKILGLSIDNYYNKHLLAKRQFITLLEIIICLLIINALQRKCEKSA